LIRITFNFINPNSIFQINNMAENNIMGLVGAFIGIAIMLGIGVQILGNSVQDCTTLPDYNATAGATQTGVI
jgi:hypothetical protein